MSGKTITIITMGSRGDVQPYIALGLGLEKTGYRVRIAAPAVLCNLVTQYGYGLTALPIHAVDPQAFLGKAAVRGASKQRLPLRQMRTLLREARPLISDFLDEVWQACQGSDAIIASTIFFGAQDSAEKLDVPCVYTFLHPFFPTSSFASPLTPKLPESVGIFNRTTHTLAEQVFWQAFRPAVNALRKRLGLPYGSLRGPHHLLRQRTSLVLFGFSPAVVPKPEDWPDHTHVTGYWFLNEPSDWTPPAELQTFLDSGPPPIYVGFGSMTDRAADRTTQLIIDAAARAGQRVVLASGWGGLGHASLPETVFRLEAAPHAWLFPQVSAVTHHGGAGTTGAGFRAGVPSIVTPFVADQPFWADRAFALGVGPEPISYHRLTVDALATRFQTAVENNEMRKRAKRLEQTIRAEYGVGKAVALIDAYLKAHSRYL